MVSVLRQYVEDGYLTTEYSRDGKTVSSMVRELISEPIDAKPINSETTIEEQILAETHYQTALLEMTMMGGM